MSNDNNKQQAPFYGYKFEYDNDKKAPESTENNTAQYHYIDNSNEKNGEDKFLRIVMLMFSAIMLRNEN